MIKIHKYTLPSYSRGLTLHRGAEILAVDNQREELCIWVKEDEDEGFEIRDIFATTTGATVTPGSTHLGTVLFDKGNFVAHVFEVKANARNVTSPKDLAL